MAYTKTNWTNGDLITASKLNKIEQGIADGSSGGGVLFINAVEDGTTITLDKTWQEIYDAYISGVLQVVIQDGSGDDYVDIVLYVVTGITSKYNYSISIVNATPSGNFILDFSCESPDEYPSYSSNL